jgi:hypothetical protein
MQVQLAIQLVYRFRKVSTPIEQFVKVDFVGLDCNGFVGNFLWHEWRPNGWTNPGLNPDDPDVHAFERHMKEFAARGEPVPRSLVLNPGDVLEVPAGGGAVRLAA